MSRWWRGTPNFLVWRENFNTTMGFMGFKHLVTLLYSIPCCQISAFTLESSTSLWSIERINYQTFLKKRLDFHSFPLQSKGKHSNSSHHPMLVPHSTQTCLLKHVWVFSKLRRLLAKQNSQCEFIKSKKHFQSVQFLRPELTFCLRICRCPKTRPLMRTGTVVSSTLKTTSTPVWPYAVCRFQ